MSNRRWERPRRGLACEGDSGGIGAAVRDEPDMLRWLLWLACAALVADAMIAYRSDLASFDLPPLSNIQVQQHHEGKLIWAET